MASPFGPMTLIVNPVSGRGRVAEALPKIEDALRAADLGHGLAVTRGPGDATRAARAAMEAGGRFIVAVGGDGTIHEAVNGMLTPNGRPLQEGAVLGVIAAGSGSDFVRTFDLPADWAAACARLAGDATRPLDIGKVTHVDHSSGEQATTFFANIAEVGIGAAVVERAANLPRSLGRSRYLAALGMVLPGFRATRVRLEVDGRAFGGRVHNVVIANCRYFGGGMHVSPTSSPEDGTFEVLVFKGPKSQSFTFASKVFRGMHLPHEDIVELSASHVRVEAEQPLPIEADGELLGDTPVTFEVVPTPLMLKI
jgi:YegS/Rv2252/BmrU family lipid kinase